MQTNLNNDKTSYGILPSLSKSYILNNISQETIFSKFMNISINDIYWCLENTSNLIKSPLRVDNNPTMGFIYVGNKLRCKDFSGHFWGDCFDLVAFVCNFETKQIDFIRILETIAKEFKIHKFKDSNEQSSINTNLKILKQNKKEIVKKEFTFKKRELNKYDALFWSKNSYTKSDLSRFKIYAIQTIFINNEIIYDYVVERNPKDICYLYDLDNNNVQFYFPNREKGKFLTNFSGLLGKSMIKSNKILLITKSYKDICTFEKLIEDTLPITVDAPTSENFLLTKDMYINLWCNYTDFYSLMDFDFTGRALAFKMKRLYGIKPLFFTNGKRGTKYDFKVKDLTDYVKKYGTDNAIKLINNVYNSLIK